MADLEYLECPRGQTCPESDTVTSHDVEGHPGNAQASSRIAEHDHSMGYISFAKITANS